MASSVWRMGFNDQHDRRWMVLFVAAALVLAVSHWRPGQSAGVKPVAERKQAPDLTLFQLGGGEWKLADRRGQVVMINYWATWCEPCRDELPGLVQVARESAPKGLAVVGISMDSNPNAQEKMEAVQQFVTLYRLPYPIAFPSVTSNPETGGAEIPTTVLIDRQGRIAKTYVGEVERAVLAKDVAALLAES